MEFIAWLLPMSVQDYSRSVSGGALVSERLVGFSWFNRKMHQVLSLVAGIICLVHSLVVVRMI